MCIILKGSKHIQLFKSATFLTIRQKVAGEKHNKTLIIVPYILTGIK